MGRVLGCVLWQLLVEESEETAVVVVQVIDQLIGIPGTSWVGSYARFWVSAGVVTQQRSSAKHQ